MCAASTDNLLEALYQEKEELKKEIDALDLVIARFERRPGATKYAEPFKAVEEVKEAFGSTGALFPSIKEKQGVKGEIDQNFPKGSDIKSQILYVLQRLGKAQRYPELQDEYTNLSKSRRNIRKDLIDLRKNGSLVAIKYNNNFAQTYQGLPEWVHDSEVGVAFKDEFLDISSIKFPTGIHRSEKIEDDKS